MAEMDFKKRQDSPTQTMKEERVDFKLKLRREKLKEILRNKRNPTNQIQGLNLHICKKRHPKIKKCWCCGSKNHLKIDYPIHREKQLLLWVREQEKKMQQLEEDLKIIKKNKAKKERGKKRRKDKKRAPAEGKSFHSSRKTKKLDSRGRRIVRPKKFQYLRPLLKQDGKPRSKKSQMGLQLAILQRFYRRYGDGMQVGRRIL